MVQGECFDKGSAVIRKICFLSAVMIALTLSSANVHAACPVGYTCDSTSADCPSGWSLSKVRYHTGQDCDQTGMDYAAWIAGLNVAYTDGCCSYIPTGPDVGCNVFRCYAYGVAQSEISQVTVTSSAKTTVTGVPLGGSYDAAKLAYENWLTAGPDLPTVEGRSLTSKMSGFVFSEAYNVEDNTQSVVVDMWMEGGFTNDGEVIPLEGITGPGGSGSGTSPADIQTGVEGALESKGLTGQALEDRITAILTAKGLSGDELKQGTKDALGYANSQGWLGAGQTDGLTQAQLAESLTDALGEKVEETDPVLDVGFTGQSQNEIDNPAGLDVWPEAPERDSITEKVTGFLQGNPVLNIFQESGLEVAAGACSMSGSYTMAGRAQTWTFSLCEFQSSISLLGSIVLGVATIYSIFIAMGRA